MSVGEPGDVMGCDQNRLPVQCNAAVMNIMEVHTQGSILLSYIVVVCGVISNTHKLEPSVMFSQMFPISYSCIALNGNSSL